MPANTRTHSRSEMTARMEKLGDHGIDVANLSSESLAIVTSIINYFESKYEMQSGLISELREDVVNLRKRVCNLEEKLDDSEQYLRRDTLVVSGDIPEVRDGENCNQIVRNLMKNQIKLEIRADDISIAHRIGRKPQNQEKDKRKIIFKLCRRDIKSDIFSACRNANPKPRFLINESLTPKRNTIMFILRKAKEKHSDKIKAVRSREGNVTVFMGGRDGLPLRSARRLIINSRVTLEEFLRSELNEQLSEFCERWPHNEI